MNLTLIDLWAHMGLGARLITVTMLAMSVASIVVVVERITVLSRSRRQSLAYAARLASVLEAGDVDRAAAELSDERGGHLGRVLQAALRTYRTCPKSDEDFTFESVARVLERQAQREVHDMKRGVAVLANVASMAPFVGLLGTVLGIVNAFGSMAKSGAGGLANVSEGISEALVTTALGLLVAIPSIGAYNGMVAWIEARAVDISEASNELLDLLAHHLRQARPGPREVSTSQRPRPSVAAER